MMDELIVSSSRTRRVIVVILFRFTGAAPWSHCYSTDSTSPALSPNSSASGEFHIFLMRTWISMRDNEKLHKITLREKRKKELNYSWEEMWRWPLSWEFKQRVCCDFLPFTSVLTTLSSKGVNMDEFTGCYVVELPCWQADEACWLDTEGDCIENVSPDVGRSTVRLPRIIFLHFSATAVFVVVTHDKLSSSQTSGIMFK